MEVLGEVDGVFPGVVVYSALLGGGRADRAGGGIGAAASHPLMLPDAEDLAGELQRAGGCVAVLGEGAGVDAVVHCRFLGVSWKRARVSRPPTFPEYI